ncbi:hypothetical protein scyTo_0006581 [Scyliorhinus torazame]|uniref:BSD domain-containing protein n=1 Tax=Scyliorhinus torazame TaxID=75743 RepID=A0A401PIR8_SCYTO|nr:hypothetical protein [Scyliorhinus torazame]
MADRRWWGDWIQQNISTMKTKVEEHTEEDQAFSKGLSSLLGAISEVFTPTVKESITTDVKTIKDFEMRNSQSYDGFKVRLCNLQANPATYSSTADDQYNIWLLTFSLEFQKRAISDLLVNSPQIRDLYTKLVPSEVTHADFWCRYFYRVHQLYQEEARRRALKERAEQSTHSEDLKWEDNEDELEGTSVSSAATSTPNNLNEVTNNWHSRTHEQPGYKVQETGLGVTVTSLSESASNEMQPVALSSVEDNKGIQYDGTRIGENTPGFEECSISTLELRNHDSIYLQPDIAQNATVELNTNIDEPAFMGRNGNTSNYVENWDEDLDLDMTEEEIRMTLSRAEASGELEAEELDDWACDQN